MSDPFAPVSVSDAKRRLDDGWTPYVLDVRSAAEVAVVQLDFADRATPHTEVLGLVDELPKDRDVLVYCKAGGRSAVACHMLAAAGFDRLYNLEGGIGAWVREIDPTLPQR
jgi:sulfur-carrier protein adenylyltransferase/sulfurtransferase